MQENRMDGLFMNCTVYIYKLMIAKKIKKSERIVITEY